MSVEVRRDTGRAFFQSLEKFLRADEFLSDKKSVALRIQKAAEEQSTGNRKRFDPDHAFRHKILYDRLDEFIADWCRRRDIKADPLKVFRYEGPERGPTQHEIAIGPSMAFVNRAFDRLVEAVPEIPDQRSAVAKAPTKAIAPAFRLQFPLPFGACGEVRYGGGHRELFKDIFNATQLAATRGDVSRGWTYDCGVLIFYGTERPRTTLGDELWENWPEIQMRIWQSARLWVMVL